jgi:hypothetical protein
MIALAITNDATRFEPGTRAEQRMKFTKEA